VKRGGSTRAWRRRRQYILQRDHYLCHYCGAPATEVDHVIPHARGGSDAISNLVASCRPCNLSKGAKLGGGGKKKNPAPGPLRGAISLPDEKSAAVPRRPRVDSSVNLAPGPFSREW
jgi:5-methylcytosine-specific restriction endonuclease McrA